MLATPLLLYISSYWSLSISFEERARSSRQSRPASLRNALHSSDVITLRLDSSLHLKPRFDVHSPLPAEYHVAVLETITEIAHPQASKGLTTLMTPVVWDHTMPTFTA